MLRFSVFDHDLLSFNDFAGEAFLALDSVPGLAGGGTLEYHGLRTFSLPLGFQEYKGKNSLQTSYDQLLTSDHPVLTTLEARQADKIAQDFVKKQRQRVVST